MCINPSEYQGRTFGCRKCWQCDENRIQDWVGRSIAETKTSTRSYFITLTYGGGDTERATVLTYSDVQKYLKRLRKAKYRLKYIVSGEYGSAKGRAHWHIMLFFQGRAPKMELRKEQSFIPFWDHGYSYVDDVNPSSARYVCKYIKKDEGDEEAQASFRQSKKPPIGTEYFEGLAEWHADNGVSPKTLVYTFDENRNKDGQRIKHFMHGATARDFLQACIDKGVKYQGEPGWGYSPLLDAFADKQECYAPDPLLEGPRYGDKPNWVPRRDCEARFSEPHNAYQTDIDGSAYWWWPLDRSDPKGEHAWQSAKGTDVIRWEDSDRYADLQWIGDYRKRKLDQQRKTAQRSVSEMRSSEKAHSRMSKGRLPMVGDTWS